MPDDIIIRNKKRLSSRSRKPEVGSEKESPHVLTNRLPRPWTAEKGTAEK